MHIHRTTIWWYREYQDNTCIIHIRLRLSIWFGLPSSSRYTPATATTMTIRATHTHKNYTWNSIILWKRWDDTGRGGLVYSAPLHDCYRRIVFLLGYLNSGRNCDYTFYAFAHRYICVIFVRKHLSSCFVWFISFQLSLIPNNHRSNEKLKAQQTNKKQTDTLQCSYISVHIYISGIDTHTHNIYLYIFVW